MSDSKILRLSYKRPSVFKQLFDRHNKRFLAIAKKSLSSREEAEDAVQETFIRVYRHGNKFLKSKGRFKEWSNAILKNCIIDQLRKRKLQTLPITEELEAVLEAPDEIASKESDNYFSSILSKMSSLAKEVLRLRFILGKSFKEIGKIMHTTSGAARVRVFRARKIFIEIHKGLDGYKK